MHSGSDAVWSGGEWTGKPIYLCTCKHIHKQDIGCNFNMSQEVCHQYWPSIAGKQHYGDLLVEKAEENKYDGYTERVLSITNKVGVGLY